MPRHFLVKRQKNDSSLFSQHEPRVGDCRDLVKPLSCHKAGLDKTISVIKENDGGDYGSYGSPDSGYADSPKSLHIGSSKDKEHFFPDREQSYRNRNVLDKSETSTTDCTETMNACHVMQGHFVPNIDFPKALGIDANNEGPIDLSVTGSKNSTNPPKSDRFQKYHNYFHPNPYNDPKHMQSSRLHFQQQQIEQQPRIQIPPFQADSVTGALYLNSLSPYGLQTMPLSLQHQLLSTISPSFAVSSNASSIDLSQEVREKNISRNRPSSKTEALLLHSQDGHLRKESTKGGLPSLTIPILPSMVSSLSPGEMKPLNLHKLFPASSSPPNRSPRRKRCNSDHSNSSENTDNIAQDLSKPSAESVISGKDSSATPPSKLSQTATAESSSKSKSTTAPAVKKTSGSTPTSNKKLKAVRKLNFDVDTTSPVSGTIIKDASEFHPEARLVYGDIEPSFNFVEATPEARAELEKIENKIGDYICQLCKELFEDAFQLAQHRCSRIVHVEYRCPECDKVFNCPANLASHRRWHKPRTNSKAAGNVTSKTSMGTPIAPKPDCNGNDVKHTLPVPSKWKRYTKEGFETHVMPVKNEDSQSLTHEAHCVDPLEIENESDKSNPFPKLEPSAADNGDRGNGGSNLGETTSSVLITDKDTNSSFSDKSSSLTAEERSLVLQVLNNNSHGYTSASAPPSLSPISVSHSETEIELPERIPTLRVQSEDNVENITTRISTTYGNASDLSCRSRTSFKDNNFSPFHHEFGSRHTPPPYSYNSKNNFQCSSCGKSFQRHAYLRKHILSQHKTFNDDSSIKMTINDIVTEALNLSDNERERKQQSGEMHSNLCAICSKTFISESACLKHEALAHGIKVQATCSQCQQTFASKLALDKHTRIAHSSESFACKYCSSAFHSSPGLTRHINKCHPTENRQVILLQIPATCT